MPAPIPVQPTPWTMRATATGREVTLRDKHFPDLMLAALDRNWDGALDGSEAGPRALAAFDGEGGRPKDGVLDRDELRLGLERHRQLARVIHEAGNAVDWLKPPRPAAPTTALGWLNPLAWINEACRGLDALKTAAFAPSRRAAVRKALGEP